MADTKQFDWDAWCARRRELEERGFFDDYEICDEDDNEGTITMEE